jgi:hypothetical protein
MKAMEIADRDLRMDGGGERAESDSMSEESGERELEEEGEDGESKVSEE